MNWLQQLNQRLAGFTQPTDMISKPGVEHWRESIFQQMLKSLTVLGVFVAMLSAWLSFRAGLFGMGVFAILGYLLFVTLFFARGLGHQARVTLFLLILFAVSFFVMTETGVSGAGFIWLFIVPATASLLLGLSWGMIFLGFNVLISLRIGYLIGEYPLTSRR